MSISKKQQSERLAVCQRCPQNTNGRCFMCGCKVEVRIKKENGYRKIGNKEYLTRPACPLKKWPEYR